MNIVQVIPANANKYTFSTGAKCNQVLQGEGRLCFSDHGSIVEGWVAIYNGVTDADCNIVAAYPDRNVIGNAV